MHRLSHNQSQASNMLAGSLLLAMLLMACGGAKPEVRDPAYVETLRLKITKVRNAIEETRSTIALSRGAPYLPELYVRLAELLSEEGRYHYRLAYEREQRASRVLHVPQVRVLKEQSIELYESVLARFPDSPLLPRALFNIGHEHRELGNFDEMREVLKRLDNDYPDSPLRFDGLLVLGDYHFDRSELDDAGVYYADIAKADLNRLSGLGHYKLAWVYVNQGECVSAIRHFEDAIDTTDAWEARQREGSADNNQGLTDVDIDVRREALVDMAYCYSQERKAKGAVAYFRQKAYNRATYLAALNRLAHRYRVMDQAEGARAATRELLRLGPANEDRLDDARTLYAALKKRKTYNQIDSDMKLIADALTRYYTHVTLDNEPHEQLASEFEVFMRDLATSAQAELAKKSEKDQVELAEKLAVAYRVYIDTFPDADAKPDMLLNMADVLELAEMPLEAGLRAAEAAGTMEDGPAKSDAYYDAVVYFQASLDQESNRMQYERVTARASLRRAAQSLLAFELDAQRARRVKFAIAQTYYDEGQYREAIDKLSAVAYEFPGTKEADACIGLVLDSYNTINDYDGLMYAGRRLLADGSPASDTLRGELRPIVAAAEQRKLDELSLTAAGEDGGDISVLEEFAVQNQGTDLGERALLNAFVAARAVGDSEKMYALAEQIAQSYPASGQLPGVYATIAQTAVARFEYDRAIAFLRRAADVNPEQKVRLVTATGDLLEQLGDLAGAEGQYAAAAAAAEPQARADVLDAYSALLERQGDPGKLERGLAPYLDDAGPDALARLGVAQVALKRIDTAETTLQRALSAAAISPMAEAQAQYGMAEVLLGTLAIYPEPDDFDLLQEFITLVEVVEEGYLNSARQGTPEFAAATLARLAYASRFSATRLRNLRLPPGLGATEEQQVRAALIGRAETLEATAAQAIDACAQQAWASRILTPVVRGCIQGQALESIIIPVDVIRPRGGGASPQGLDELRKELSKNPEDVPRLLELGEKFLDAQDPHVARLVLARAVQSGGGPPAQNLLGIASYRVGDISGAFEAFASAAEGGSEGARQNIASMMREIGLGDAATKALEKYSEGTPGDRLLNK